MSQWEGADKGMYSIGEAARITGVSAYTLRYYEQIGLLPSPQRQGGKPEGVRQYTDQDLRFIQFIYGLKQTGMKLEDIAAFTEDGCLLSGERLPHDIEDTLYKRMDMLDRHLARLNTQIEQLESVRTIAEEKRKMYAAMLLTQEKKAMDS
ncbi:MULTISPECIES: MerR family transcriptional regulator [Paenibacillus]|uniref:MerR family transcriptional regulator n=1 Tax=Paenibacillus alvei TaxID=44250 RepID=A0ABT4E554_PAEAL|nr:MULTISPECIES: MerR family transcriptional regulator [Paenibacillus]MCY9528881.1 MerR family transcriptional regulator [Paenibacillus alvei]